MDAEVEVVVRDAALKERDSTTVEPISADPKPVDAVTKPVLRPYRELDFRQFLELSHEDRIASILLEFNLPAQVTVQQQPESNTTPQIIEEVPSLDGEQIKIPTAEIPQAPLLVEDVRASQKATTEETREESRDVWIDRVRELATEIATKQSPVTSMGDLVRQDQIEALTKGTLSEQDHLKRLIISFPEYEFKGKLDEGGFCFVFEALYKKTGQEFVFKVPKIDSTLNRIRLDIEKNVSRYVGELAPDSTLACEMVDNGETGVRALRVDKATCNFQSVILDPKIPVEQKLLHFREALQILHAMHTAEPALVYGDISPRNFLIGADGRLKLGDFSGMPLGREGAAQFVTSILQSADITSAFSSFATTEGYRAPETKQGKLLAVSDVYSFGMVLSQLLHGNADEFRVIPLGSDLARFNKLIMAATEPNPLKRTPSVEAFLEEFQAAAAPYLKPLALERDVQSAIQSIRSQLSTKDLSERAPAKEASLREILPTEIASDFLSNIGELVEMLANLSPELVDPILAKLQESELVTKVKAVVEQGEHFTTAQFLLGADKDATNVQSLLNVVESNNSAQANGNLIEGVAIIHNAAKQHPKLWMDAERYEERITAALNDRVQLRYEEHEATERIEEFLNPAIEGLDDFLQQATNSVLAHSWLSNAWIKKDCESLSSFIDQNFNKLHSSNRLTAWIRGKGRDKTFVTIRKEAEDLKAAYIKERETLRDQLTAGKSALQLIDSELSSAPPRDFGEAVIDSLAQRVNHIASPIERALEYDRLVNSCRRMFSALEALQRIDTKITVSPELAAKDENEFKDGLPKLLSLESERLLAKASLVSLKEELDDLKAREASSLDVRSVSVSQRRQKDLSGKIEKAKQRLELIEGQIGKVQDSLTGNMIDVAFNRTIAQNETITNQLNVDIGGIAEGVLGSSFTNQSANLSKLKDKIEIDIRMAASDIFLGVLSTDRGQLETFLESGASALIIEMSDGLPYHEIRDGYFLWCPAGKDLPEDNRGEIASYLLQGASGRFRGNSREIDRITVVDELEWKMLSGQKRYRR